MATKNSCSVRIPKSTVICFSFPVNIGILEERIESEKVITPESLIEKGIIRKIKGRVPEVKILGKGKLTKKLIIESCDISKGAKDKIEKVGGTIR